MSKINNVLNTKIVVTVILSNFIVNQSHADSDFFINGGTNSDCTRTFNKVGASPKGSLPLSIYTLGGEAKVTCPTRYGDSNGSSLRSWSLDGELFVTSGRLALGEGTASQGMRIGSITTLNGQSGKRAIAIGAGEKAALASGDDAIAVGSGAKAASSNGLALGKGSVASNTNDVALGADSHTAKIVATSGVTLLGQDYAFAGSKPTGTVSVGDKGAERTLTNVAAGRIDATSTDAVNGSQLHATNQAVEHLGGRVDHLDASIDTASASIRNLEQGALQWNKETGAYDASRGTGSAQKISHVAQGELSRNSTDAVNGSQLYATNQEIGTVKDGIAEIGRNTIKYDLDSEGMKRNSVTLQGGDPNAPVVLANVASGVRTSDAVNLGQLRESVVAVQQSAKNYTDERTSYAITSANSYTDRQVRQGRAYTDEKFGMLSGHIGEVRREARQAAAIGLAAASLRYDERPGKLSMAIGGGVWRKEGAFAAGLGYTSEDSRFRSNVSLTAAGRSVGGGFGLSYTFN